MQPRRILITGAAGIAGSGLRPLLRERGHSLVLFDLQPVTAERGERSIVGSLTDPEAVREAMQDIEVVVHLGGHSRERPWQEISAVNVTGTQVVLDAARRSGVRHLLLASSTHAVGFVPVPQTPVGELAPRPDSMYGVGKVAMEAMASVYADRFDLRIVNARIGTVEDAPTGLRSLSTWLSFADFVRLIEATAALDEPGCRTVWAISANTRAWFDVSNGQGIGYYPEDDAEHAAPTIGPDAVEGNGLIGGAFADPEHELGVPW